MQVAVHFEAEPGYGDLGRNPAALRRLAATDSET